MQQLNSSRLERHRTACNTIRVERHPPQASECSAGDGSAPAPHMDHPAISHRLCHQNKQTETTTLMSKGRHTTTQSLLADLLFTNELLGSIRASNLSTELDHYCMDSKQILSVRNCYTYVQVFHLLFL